MRRGRGRASVDVQRWAGPSFAPSSSREGAGVGVRVQRLGGRRVWCAGARGGRVRGTGPPPASRRSPHNGVTSFETAGAEAVGDADAISHRWGGTRGAEQIAGQPIVREEVGGRTTAWVPARQK